MSNELYDLLGFTPKDVADVEGWEAEVRMAVDKMIEGVQRDAAAGVSVTPYTVMLSLALSLRRDSGNLVGLLASAAEAFYRLAFPREEMPPI